MTVYQPDVKVEIAWDAGYATDSASRTWTDVSDYVEMTDRITINHGRPDEFGTAEPNRVTLTLDNSDGRFTAGYTSGAYYPNVKIGRPIKVTTTVDSVDYIRFLGYIDEWPLEWPGSSNRATATITASSRSARLGLDVPLRAFVTEEIIDTEPLAYWPMGEDEGSLEAADVFGGPSLRSRNVTPVVFGAALNLFEDSTTGVTFDSVTNSYMARYLAAPVDNNARDISIECVTTGDLATTGFIWKLTGDRTTSGPTGIYQLRLGLQATNAFKLSVSDGDGNEIAACWSSSKDPALTHHVMGRLHVDNAFNTRVTLRVATYGVGLEEQTGTGTARGVGTFNQLSVGFNTNQTVGHMVLLDEVFDETDYYTRFGAALTGGIGVGHGAWIARYARFANVPSSEIDVGTDVGYTYPIDIAGTTPIEAMQRIAVTEGGVLFDSPDNILTFKHHDERYSQPTAVTIDAAKQELETGVTPKLDRSALFNDVTATSPIGASARVFDQASIDEYGVSRTTLDTLLIDVDQAYQAATWHLSLYRQPLTRIPNVPVDFLGLPLATQTAIMSADIGSVMSITGMPSQAPAASLRQFIEGWTETIGFATYDFEFNVSSAAGYDVWTLEDPVLGAYDSNPLAY